MTSCPIHSVLLEEIFVSVGQARSCEIEEPVPAPSEILTIDRLTWQALQEGSVSLPHSPVSGGRWLRMLRALLDELILPAAPLKQYRPTVLKIWGTLGLRIRQGMRSASIPFERLDSERQFLLMRLAGVAVELLMVGAFKRVGKDALLFTARPADHEDRLAPSQDSSSMQSETPILEGVSAYEQAWRKVHTAWKDWEVAMRHDVQPAIQMRQILLGTHPTPEKIEAINSLFRELGYVLPNDVI